MDNRQLVQAHFPELFELVMMLQSLTLNEIIKFVLAFAITYFSSVLVLKNALIFVLRVFGLHHPSLYGYLSSAVPCWRFFYGLKMKFGRWHEFVFRFSKLSTSGFAPSLATMTYGFSHSKVLIGRVYLAGFGLYQSVGIKVSRHIMVYAMTGAGKTSWLITMLSTWLGSAIIIDPKAQITDTLCEKDKRRWVKLAPYEQDTAQWNPIDDIRFAMQRRGDDVAVLWTKRLAESIVITPPKASQPYFTQNARGFVTALILHVLSHHREEEQTLPYIFTLATQGYRVLNDDGSIESTEEEAQALLFNSMRENDAFGGAISENASAYIEVASSDTGKSVISTLRNELLWISIPKVKHFLSATTAPLALAKTRNDIVFSFCVQTMSLRLELKPLLRLFTNFVIFTFEDVKKKNGQCLFVNDEVQSQGHNATLEMALAVMRSYGITFVCLSQDREGMKGIYPNAVNSFEGNADVVLHMATNHIDNLKHIHTTLGRVTLVATDAKTGKKSYRDVDVLTAEQINRFLSPETGNLIAIRAGGRPFRLKIANYFNELPVTRYKADSDHKEPLPKRFTRLVVYLSTFKFLRKNRRNSHDIHL